MKAEAEERARIEAEAKAKAEAEAKARAEAERVAREKRLAEEAAAAAAAQSEAEQRRVAQQRLQLQQLQKRYFNALRQRVNRNWRRPPGIGGNVECVVSVVQLEGGDIVDVDVESCRGGNAALEKSVERAVLSSSPLPLPPRPEMFDRQLRFYFRPN